MAETQPDNLTLQTEIEALRGRMDVLQKSIDLMTAQLNLDRGDIDSLKTSQATGNAQNDQILQRFERLEETVKTAIGLSMKKELSPVKRFLSAITESKKKVVEVKQYHWWTRFTKKG